MFETNFARVGTFLTAYGRAEINKYFPDQMEGVIRCHTDGIYFDRDPKITSSDELGAMKVKEGHLTFTKSSGKKVFQ